MLKAAIIGPHEWNVETRYLVDLVKELQKIDVDTKVFHDCPKFLLKFNDNTALSRVLATPFLLKNPSGFDLIHIHSTYPIGFGFSILKYLHLLNKPTIIQTHGFDVFSIPSIQYGLRRNKIGKILTSFAWKNVEKIIAVCEKSKSEIMNAGILGEKINVLHNCVDEKLFLKNTSNIPDELLKLQDSNDLIFLSVASSLPVKNQERMIIAFNNLMEKYRSKLKIKLVLIGKKSHSLIKNKNRDILWLGEKNHSELYKFYSIADAFVLPSLSEAHPLAMLEAMSCELPVIASNVGGIPETIPNSKYLVNPLDVKDIEKKFELIVQMNKKERERIGSQNRDQILRHFTYTKHVNKLKKIYQSILNC